MQSIVNQPRLLRLPEAVSIASKVQSRLQFTEQLIPIR
jgi:hypothetical protein